MPQSLLAFEPDLMFSSKIESVSRRLGITSRISTSLEEFLNEFANSKPSVVTLNLDALEGKLEALENVASISPYVIGYYSHVNQTLADEAVRLGVKTVLPRGAFISKFEAILESSP